ncbi:Putative ATP-dependent protease La, LON [Pseudooceanicola batsensis HTCC2597]|uniref:Putative ATP-dependent protease La, LON n=1 Tax=Pseudooceanicola batsensis (strain ATCC BAA-863 / DSM 15984 / KCTC 12145 / HTCC2597) TaxID=252305 RepID=A3TWH0_PSEBH|nr:LON peptidase substrate-binding domain-containing protein [Pseudooceanicola batsensis]EAQ03966.1 Putative ATP-dependent protease La, LON [Pseudooceanicola batsensis HTCC2597]
MMKTVDLPDVIPVFPLSGALLLPRARLPLHLFEPRYLVMLDDILKTSDRLIGMVQPDPNPKAASGREGPPLHSIGCAGRVTQFSETEDGRYMITLAGMSRFRIREEVDGFTPYRRAAMSWAGFDRDLGQSETDPGFQREPFLNLLGSYFRAKSLDTDWDALQKADDEMLINSLSMLLSFEPEEKQALLEAPSLTTRRETLVTLIEYAMRGGEDHGMMQ